jgi:hypothetical protein
MSEGFVYVFILKSTSPHGFMAWWLGKMANYIFLDAVNVKNR